MVKELVIQLYLLIFKIVFNIFNLFPLKNKVAFVVSFGDNTQYVYEEMRRKHIAFDVVFLCKGTSYKRFQQYEDATIALIENKNPIDFIQSIFHLATSSYVFVDNYYGFLAATDFRPEVECVQLWHASGAIKKFGLEDASVQNRSDQAVKRFMDVYKRFNQVVVGSDIMSTYFMNAFNLKGENILRTGIPRTDFFYNQTEKERVFNQLTKENRLLWEKKVILYAPTYRDNELNEFQLELDLKKLYDELHDDYVVMLRLHPAIKNIPDYTKIYPDFVLNYSKPEYDINELLVVADVLITDYSSISFEFSLLKKPMIFFAYDLVEYTKDRGLWEQYEKMVPGPVVNNTEAIIDLIKENSFDMDMIEEYANKWNKYSKGHSSENLISYLFDEKTILSKQRAL
ncbi:CDP-glycerol glycerophosphotransferase family protein [Pradoshia sp. D12]|uniref:CDP-glycerol glycerophosphotransferase family protein n=1 Tax=Bacillaceae TaxID=186817 RepID=UPI00112A4532|nr:MULTISPECIES: CDP-glycerol glycerophosphotransferase family protein [Bacillaceae]QFK72891.1 CDP-glycerol glycerophosphotransferase family protein [Pradoshia sp. D12]TPF71883.1 CDP-glycerol glycerophosphotransferase family protein [Bacillus sp. D12]